MSPSAPEAGELSPGSPSLEAGGGSGADKGAGDGSAPSIGSTFDVVIRYSGDPAYQSLFDAAAVRWEQIITADIPDVNSVRWGFIDDLLIDASVAAIDGAGGILGQAGPDELRSGSRLPDHGEMEFDSADVGSMFANGTFDDVILHEMGHILGIGTIWASLGLKSGSSFIGTHAVSEYRTLTGDFSKNAVPLETGGGSGTAGSHWSEAIFDNELMTGYAEAPGVPMPLSRLTVASLWDLGYTVNLGAADQYALPGGTPTPPADDYADSLADATAPIGQVAVGGTSTGTLEIASDRDWFRVQLIAGVSYVFNLEGAPTGAGTLADPYLRFYSGSGGPLAEDDDVSAGNLNAQLTFQATASGSYYLEAGAFSDGAAGTYRLGVSAAAPNRAPTITSDGGLDSATFARPENTAAVTTVAAADQDGNALSYAIVGGADAAKFQVNGSTGALAFLAAPDFENPTDSDHNNSYVVQVRATDNGAPSLFDTQTITVNVTDVPGANLVGDGNANTLTGTPENDALQGLGGNDSLAGRGGNDTLTGGPGDDRFVYAPAGGADIFTDFAAGAGTEDKIDLTAFTSIHTLGDVLGRAAQVGSDTLLDFGGGNTITLQHVAKGALGADDFVFAATPRDFNADAKSDILWQSDDGAAAVWLMDGSSLTTGSVVGFNPGAGWKEVGSGDFNGDARSDILWQGVDGSAAVWLMDGVNLLGGTIIGFNPGAGWTAIGTGDFNADAKSDVLWQNDNGAAAVWLMDGLDLVGGTIIGFNPGAAWREVGTGDFNADGKSDVLWQNQDGAVAVWLMDGLTLQGGTIIGFNPGAAWKAIDTGDFNGGGTSDVLWQGADGSAAVWLMDGLNLLGGSTVGNPGASWHVIEAGDLNADGKSDIVWQNEDGSAAVWLMDGLQLAGSSIVGFNPGASWHVVGPGHDLF